MLILSWNVAGFSSTVHRIHSNYNHNHNNNNNINDDAAAVVVVTGDTATTTTTTTTTTDDDNEKEAEDTNNGRCCCVNRNNVNNAGSTMTTSNNNNSNNNQMSTEDCPTTNTSARKRSRIHIEHNHTVQPQQLDDETPTMLSKPQQHYYCCLSNYFQRHHNADIICIQEHKISMLQLQNHTEPYHCATSKAFVPSSFQKPQQCPQQVVGYESFWSCCTDPQSKGFNGVVTYVKCRTTTTGSTNRTTTDENDGDNETIQPNSNPTWTTTVISANGTSCFPTTDKNNNHNKSSSGTGTGTDTNTDPHNNNHNPHLLFVLNQQGRCVITEHGPPVTTATTEASLSSSSSSTTTTNVGIGFIVFNVYVPCTGFQRKMKFLHALRASMDHLRHTKQKPIILVGDLNISYSKYDTHYLNHIVYIDEIIQQVQQQHHQSSSSSAVPSSLPVRQQQSALPQWMIDIATHWSTILQILQTITVTPTTTTNSITNATYSKFRCRVTVPVVRSSNNNDNRSTRSNQNNNNSHTNVNNINDNNNNNMSVGIKGRYVYLGSHENNADQCLQPYQRMAQPEYYYDEISQSTQLVREANTPTIKILAELMNKLIFNTTGSSKEGWDDAVMRDISNTVGTVNRHSPPRLWLQSLLLKNDGMIDTFRHYYPTALGRYTCWNQNYNCRYVNEGSRIDYTLIDQSLLPFLERGNVTSLRCGRSIENEKNDPDDATATSFALSEEGAMSAITANGRYQPAPFDGAGLVEADRAVLDTQFGTAPHTGHVYTPPTFSDHIGVSLLLRDNVVTDIDMDTVRNPSTLLWNDSITRKSQPHKQQPTIGSFFQKSTLLNNIQNKISMTTNQTTTSIQNDDIDSEVEIVTSTSTEPTTSTIQRMLTSSRSHNSKQLKQPLRKKKVQPPPNSVWYHFSKKK